MLHSDENGCLVRVEDIVVGDVCLRLDVHPNVVLVPTGFIGLSNHVRNEPREFRYLHILERFGTWTCHLRR